MADDATGLQDEQQTGSALAGPPVNPAFEKALDDFVAIAKGGQRPDSKFFNPTSDWLVSHMRIFQDLPLEEQEEILQEAKRIGQEAEEASALGKAAIRAWPDVAYRLDSGGLAFFSQLGVARRPDLTQYFVDGFAETGTPWLLARPISPSSQRSFLTLPELCGRASRRAIPSSNPIGKSATRQDAPSTPANSCSGHTISRSPTCGAS